MTRKQIRPTPTLRGIVQLVAVLLASVVPPHALASTAPIFLPPVGYGSGGFAAVSLAAADLNGDGKLDLVAANLDDGQHQERFLGVLLGNGDGTFLSAVPYDTGGLSLSSGDLTSISLVIADVNRDGKLDLVVSNQGSNGTPDGSVGVLLGNGDGTFQPVVTYDSGGQFASSVFVVDLNGDGKPDIVVANCTATASTGCVAANGAGNGTVGVLLGNGDGTFRSVLIYSSGSPEFFYAPPILVTDINHDGKPDLLIGNYGLNSSNGEGSIGVLLGNGDGSFQPVVLYDSGGQAVTSIAVLDVNGDGMPDLVEANWSGSIGVLINNGDGTLHPVKSYAGGGSTFAMVVADLNGDGTPDLVLATFGGPVATLLGNGDGTFQAPKTYQTGGFSPTSLAVADVNGDGTLDLLVANECASDLCGSLRGTIGVLLGNGDGTMQPPQILDSGGDLAWSILAVDVNSDGRSDLIVADYSSSPVVPSTVAVLLNNTPILDTTPPVISLAVTPTILWPPNGKMVPVTISGTITDAGSGVNARSANFAVHDEYHLIQPHGTIALDSAGNYSFTILLQASRNGNDGDGRRYTIRVTATDNAGNRGVKQTSVTVPHSRRHRWDDKDD